jgi:hypothetical protein
VALTIVASSCFVQFAALRIDGVEASPIRVEAGSAAAPIQSCDHALDQTGMGGAGVGSLTGVGRGDYQLSVYLNPETQAKLAGGVIATATANIWTGESWVAEYTAGHPRPLNHTFHALVHLQGYSYGPRKALVLQRGMS